MILTVGEIQEEITHAWRSYIHALENAMNALEMCIQTTAANRSAWSPQWIERIEKTVDELDILCSAPKPYWCGEDDDNHMMAVKDRIQDLYAGAYSSEWGSMI